MNLDLSKAVFQINSSAIRKYSKCKFLVKYNPVKKNGIILNFHSCKSCRKLRNNAFNNTLDMGNAVGPLLQLVDLQNNQISAITLGSGIKNYTLM